MLSSFIELTEYGRQSKSAVVIKDVLATWSFKAQVASSLLQACYLAVIKPISGCVAFGLMATCLQQVVDQLDAN